MRAPVWMRTRLQALTVIDSDWSWVALASTASETRYASVAVICLVACAAFDQLLCCMLGWLLPLLLLPLPSLQQVCFQRNVAL